MNEQSIERHRLTIVVGSTREGRFGPTVADWAMRNIQPRPEWETRLVDLADLALPPKIETDLSPEVESWCRLIDASDAFVFVTPEYNHSFPASLKHAVDLARDEWQRKPAAIVSYGGMSGGLRAVEQLRLVLAELHVHTIRDGVSFHFPWNGFDDRGNPVDTLGANRALADLLADLAWWSSALRDARRHRQLVALSG